MALHKHGKAAQRRISRKVSLLRQEGRPQKQAVAIALDKEKRK